MDRDDDLVVPGMLVSHEVEMALDTYRNSLRADVEALPVALTANYGKEDLVWRDSVLALLARKGSNGP